MWDKYQVEVHLLAFLNLMVFINVEQNSTQKFQICAAAKSVMFGCNKKLQDSAGSAHCSFGVFQLNDKSQICPSLTGQFHEMIWLHDFDIKIHIPWQTQPVYL